MPRTNGTYRKGKIWWVSYRDIDGSDHHESSYSQELSDAIELLKFRQNSILEERLPDIKRLKDEVLTFDKAAERYLNFCIDQSGYVRKRGVIKQLTTHFGKLNIADIELTDIEEYQVKALASNSPQTCDHHVDVLKHIYSMCERWELVSVTVSSMVGLAEMCRPRHENLRYLQITEWLDLVEACADYAQLQMLVRISLNTGMRLGEIFALTWDCVDLDRKVIVAGNQERGRSRVIPIGDDLYGPLTRWPKHIKSEYVLWGFRGVTPRLKEQFDQVLAKCGISDFTLYDLRHTFASHLALSGVPLDTVGILLGHTSRKMTARYVHLTSDYLAEAVRNLSNRVNGMSMPGGGEQTAA